jgi:TolB-like protein/AraC-like DNA-binding protein
LSAKSKHIKLSLKDQKLLDNALRIISDHLSDESFGIEELRQGLGLSRSQLHRRLQKITGLSTSLFIRSVRLKKAYELLKEGDLSVSEVAYRTGFSSPSYFNKCFHELYGFPPGDIHKQKIAEIDQRNIFNPKELSDNDEGNKSAFRKRKLYFYGIAVLVIVILATILFNSLNPFDKTQIHEKSIAVLPFKNFSDNQENQYISDGMMEAILSNISKIGDLRVISRTSVERYRESLKSAKQIGSELGVDHILEGSTFQDDHNVRVTVQLINTKTDEHIWSDSYESELKEIFEVQSQIARRIANMLQSTITADEIKRIEQIPTANAKAYDLYQQAQFHYINFLQRRQEPDYHKCKSLFNSAIKEDTTFAAAYTRLADLYWIRNYRSEYYSDTFMDTVFLLCQKALTIDPQSSDAHRLLGQYYFETGNIERGITELETAISINKNNASAYETLGFYNNWIGNWETGIPHILKSIQLDPFSIFLPYRYGYLARAYLDILDFNNTFFYSQRVIELSNARTPALGYAYWINAHTNLILGNSKDALKAVKKLEEFNKISALRNEAEIYCNLIKDCEKGIDIYKELLEIDPDYFNYRHRYAYALWENGKYDSARLMFDIQIKAFERELELGRVERNDPYYNLAGIYAFLEDYDKAFEHLRKHRFTSGLEIYAEKDPLFKNLYDNQEFKMIIKKAKDEKQLLKNKIEEKVTENSGL